jgi:hypothetical protein
MPFLRTYEATDWPERLSLRLRIVSLILFFLPQSNRGYEGRWHLIREWLVEFDENGEAWREIGLGAEGAPVVSGPDDQNLGFGRNRTFDGVTLWARKSTERSSSGIG